MTRPSAARRLPQAGDPDLQFLRTLVHRSVGLRVRDRDLPALAAWVGERIRGLGLAAAESYAGLVLAEGAEGRLERELLTVRLTTGETYFLRDKGQFALLASRILPERIARRAAQRRLRVWSAGCSTGEEAYSLAMLLHELSPPLEGWDVQVLGTDINSRALQCARSGLYREWSFRGLDERRRNAYFRRDGADGWQIDASLRARVAFRATDLVADRFPDPALGIDDLDLIVCRNVFIYLEPPAVRAIAAKFAQALADGGYLMTGHAELLGHNTPGLHTRVFAESVVLQKSDGAPVGLPEAPAIGVEGHGQRLEALQPEASRPAAGPPREETPAAEDPQRLMQQAWRDADRGASGDAESACHRVIARAPFDPWPYYLLAQLAQERGDARRARAMLDKVIYLAPDCAPAYLELGTLLAQEGHSERARHLLRSARHELKKLPADAVVAPYGNSRAGEVLAYVEHLLDGSVHPAQAPAAQSPP